MNKTKTTWKTTDNRFVAFIDILGFKDLVNRNSHSDIYEKLSKISKTKQLLENAANKELVNERFNDVDIYIASFSDSIVIFSKNNTVDNFGYFLIAVRWLFAKTIESGIPMKGAIAYGEISLNKSEQIYFGQPIIDAYLLEEDVQYIGIVCHNTIDRFYEDNKVNLNNLKLNNLLFEDKSPLKSGHLSHLNLNWYTKATLLDETATLEDKKNRILELIKNFKYTTSGSPRKYIDNSIDFFQRNSGTKILL